MRPSDAKRIPLDFKDAQGVIANPHTKRGVRQVLGASLAGRRDQGGEPGWLAG